MLLMMDKADNVRVDGVQLDLDATSRAAREIRRSSKTQRALQLSRDIYL